METIVDMFLTRLLERVGFERMRSLVYAKTSHEATSFILFGWRNDPRGYCAMSCNIGVAFELLASVAHHEAANFPTPDISMPLHLLKPGGDFTEWQFTDKGSLTVLEDDILNDLKQFALPFLNTYSKIVEVRKRLESTPDQWFVLSPEQRVTLLAAIQYSQGEKNEAIRTLDEALTDRKNALPKKRLPIELMRKRLLTET